MLLLSGGMFTCMSLHKCVVVPSGELQSLRFIMHDAYDLSNLQHWLTDSSHTQAANMEQCIHDVKFLWSNRNLTIMWSDLKSSKVTVERSDRTSKTIIIDSEYVYEMYIFTFLVFRVYLMALYCFPWCNAHCLFWFDRMGRDLSKKKMNTDFKISVSSIF